MFGFLKRKKREAVRINLYEVVATLERCRWEVVDVFPERSVIVVKGNYRNNSRSFDRLQLHFEGGKVKFKDGRGNPISHIPVEVEMNQLFPQLKNVLNVL